MSEAQRKKLQALDAVLYNRPPGADILNTAIETIHRLRARIERMQPRIEGADEEREKFRTLQAAAFYFAHCPQCGCAETCADGCTFALDAPNDHQHMLLLRSALCVAWASYRTPK
jgi:hypothetical protein